MTASRTRPPRPAYRCGECGAAVPRWVGRCPECQAWGSVAEARTERVGSRAPAPRAVSAAARPIPEIDADAALARPTGVGELDRVLGGGLVPGSVVLLAGEPGVGKSTLLLEVAARCARPAAPTLYVTGEESVGQVRLRAGRTGTLDPMLYLAAETDLGAILAHIDAVQPGLVVVDSVQTVADGTVEGAAGGVTQVRSVAAALTAVAKERGIATVLVGHVTKEGSIAGPRVLEHLVDVVLHFEGERHSPLRLLRAVKNRYGAVDEVGCFTLTEQGIVGLADPSGLFLTQRALPVPGTCVTVTLEGRRPLPAEVQALVHLATGPHPRRAVSGLDASRVAMTLAVVDRLGGVSLGGKDVYTATVGGVRVTEPAGDLAIAIAVAGAASGMVLRAGTVALGEVGLAGDVRPVPGTARRLAELSRLGFSRALVPPGGRADAPPGITVEEVPTVADAIARLRTAPQAGLRAVRT